MTADVRSRRSLTAAQNHDVRNLGLKHFEGPYAVLHIRGAATASDPSWIRHSDRRRISGSRTERALHNPDTGGQLAQNRGPDAVSRNPGGKVVGALLLIRPSSGYPDNVSVIVVPESLPQDPLAALRVLTDSEHELDRIRREQVIAARAAGASWQQIGHALGVTRQSAWESFTTEARSALASNVDANTELAEDDALDLAVDEVRAVRRRRPTS